MSDELSDAPSDENRNEAGLNPRQQRFCDEYLVDLNATRAYCAAGYEARGASATSAAWRLLRNVDVCAYIDAQRAEDAETFKIDRHLVLGRLVELATSDMRRFASWDADGVRLLDSEDLPDGISGAVSEVSQTASQHGTSVKLKLHDPKVALLKLGEHLGLWNEGPNRGGEPLPFPD